MNEDRCLVNMSKYISTEETTSIENFATESFVFLLYYLKYINSKYLSKILSLFGLNNINKKELNITTQLRTTSLNQIVIPDIIIEYENKMTVIEVKIDSPLNNRKINNKNYTQLELYNKIKNTKEIILLSKRVVQSNKFKRILWSNIYDILSEGNDDYIVNTFLVFMEENGMAAYKLEKGIYTALDEIVKLYQLFEQAFVCDNYELSNKFNISKRGYLDFTVKCKNKNIFTISQVTDPILNEYFLINIVDKKLLENIRKSNYKWKLGSNWVFEELEIKKILLKGNASDQAVILNGWFDKVIKKIETFSKAKNGA